MLDSLFEEFKAGFPHRKFTAGLLVAMIDLLLELGLPRKDVKSYEELVRVFPKRDRTSSGNPANTLILSVGSRTRSLRPFYNAAERDFRAIHKRFDYPVCAPHATQAWVDYVSWIDRLCRASGEELASLRTDVVDFVLENLPSQEFVPGSIDLEPPVFRAVLEEFDFGVHPKEPSGAAFQGAVFGFIRADNPHLQVEIDKVRAGSRRLHRVGDVDGWDGERLAVTAEVKFRPLGPADLDSLSSFANQANQRGAIGLVVASTVLTGAAEAFADSGLKLLDTGDLVRFVDLWDPAKQNIAVESMLYYLVHVEKNSALRSRFIDFVHQVRRRK